VAEGEAPFGYAVGGIVLAGPDEKMIRPHTRRIVAAVQNHFAGGDRPIVERIADAMRAPVLAADGYDAVALSVAVRLPRPAAVTLRDIRPEAVLVGLSETGLHGLAPSVAMER
jgi:hypothetical protein